MGLSTELRDYLSLFIRTVPDPRYDAAIWGEPSMPRRCGHGMALRAAGNTLPERTIQDIVAHLFSFSTGGLNNPGSIRLAFTNAFTEFSPKSRPITE